MDLTTVILAVASPPGRSPRGIVRISGDATFELLQPHLRVTLAPSDARPVARTEEGSGGGVEESDEATARRSSDESGGYAEHSEATPRPSRYAGDTAWPRGIHRATLDLLPAPLPCLALIFPAPHSYTGQNSIELQLPGNPVLLGRVIDALLESARLRGIGARRAEPGEFTARAFMNGRMSLTEAEGVEATIAAQSDSALRAAHMLCSGRLGEAARHFVDRLAHLLALVEAGIDFTDQDDVVPIPPGDLCDALTALRAELETQLEHAVGAEQLESLPWVVLTGVPNSGKSTLFNALLGHERAVVSAVPGTTRDVLAEPLVIETDHGPAEVMLVDLAGADAAESMLDQRMQHAARETIERAELRLECVPIDEPEPRAGSSEVIVRTKADLAESPASIDDRSVAISARTGDGLDLLRARIADALADRAVSVAADALVLRPRHEALLRSARSGLDEALALLGSSVTSHALRDPELIAAALRRALDDLGSLVGDVTPDDVLGRIFASFCIGK